MNSIKGISIAKNMTIRSRSAGVLAREAQKKVTRQVRVLGCLW